MDAVHELKDFTDIGQATIVKTETADEDWINNWKQYWKPFKVDDKIWIKPTWERSSMWKMMNLLSNWIRERHSAQGMHHTTRLCIAQIKSI